MTTHRAPTGWVANAPKHDASTYGNRACRCDTCRTAHREYMRGARLRRMARRVLVDGRLLAPLPPDRHGRDTTYTNWRCQCEPCLRAHLDAGRANRQRREARG